ncbi:sporulation integral membrane protein YlbJ [Inconstantimicrobium mannanitabidum]|uniref:Sporulation integral membrane protein YlbJ n=1 Tax=Inconstantimicrobium mannanitabidum TaxID=1604901 RepID=A0ACB5RC42_9CLOT|nr:sporulation integral membrane protein YlbJ [Clostridium sp. TW13]GKX66271.1 sporulation integral membrane protein YlbJ [Clostridium sp. TW13]
MYSIIFLSLCIIILIIFLLKQLNLSRNLLATILLSLVFLYFVVKPEVCIQYSLAGAKLFITAIFPTIFPFMVICNILIAYDGINIYSKIVGPILCKPLGLSQSSSFALVASIFCGYPIGAKYSSELYEKGYINKDEFQRLINIATNSGPIFTIGAVGLSMLGNKLWGFIILGCNFLSAFIIGLLTKKKNSCSVNSPKNIEESKNIGLILKESIMDGINGVLMVGGYVIIFSILINIIKNNVITNYILLKLQNPIPAIHNIYGVTIGMLDLTNGCNLISLFSMNIKYKLCILSFLCAFGSISVIAQVNAFLYKYNLNIKKYVILKLLQGAIASVLSLITYSFIPTTVTTFANSSPTLPLYLGLELLISLLLVLCVLVYKLFHIS